MARNTYNYYQEYLYSLIIWKIILLKYILPEIIDLEILNNKKLNKELNKDSISNIADIKFKKKIIIEKKQLT